MNLDMIRQTDGVKASAKLFALEVAAMVRSAMPDFAAELEANADKIGAAIAENAVKPRNPEVVPQKVDEAGNIVDMAPQPGSPVPE